MTEKEKRARFTSEMLTRGAKRSELEPPFFRLLWSMGLRVPPPLFAIGGWQYAIQTILAAVFWGGFMWLLVWRDSLEAAVGGGILFGLLLSCFMRFQISRRRKVLGIDGDWDSYEPDETANVARAVDGQSSVCSESDNE